ncbi:hypothetical protein S7711_09437 [Stachybotrys chartarum IBT 7711]|uniref:Uncharacterized protein n=1 Tax=Stachybotrys chartarum (strain CBS 109288 / IBT 7711) TaxID=1280523 RepID=A0A084B300_STACB|nr:hypothetical protein S7711_09437 [Stachybotrys chartarum IBT 7711]KFA49455.1 hypothetical protein S40293_05739 [Stachybotrys chartarum IBT 40293]KFA78513.1 hypothetical protein S40288_01504 [Stachybotrys chartarum IBT 40288]
MRPTNYLPRPSLLLPAIASMPFFARSVVAQNDEEEESPSTSTTRRNNNDNNDEPTQTSNAPESTQTETEEDEQPATTEEAAESTTEEPSSTITEDPETTSSTRVRNTGATTGDVLTGFPTLSRHQPIPTYPPAAVPPTVDAPFMRQSTMPQGTVFIAVGAILGAFGLAILLWRFIVTIMLHRSVQRAAMAQHDANNKASFPAPPAPFYKYTDQGSTMSLSGAAAAGRGQRRTTRGPVPSTNLSQSNLFFSPTAAASTNATGNRSSAFLPSGFYAAGNSSPGPNHGHSISLSNLRPDSRGHFANASRSNLNPSPPDSPSMGPARRDMSTSSVNLNVPPTGRAPSAYLEDLLADDPGSLPPPNMPVGGQRGSVNLTSRTGSPGRRS